MKSESPIIADKELFRIWYEFYCLALRNSDDNIQKTIKKSRKFYADWEVNVDQHFDEWWQTHRELFHDTNCVSVTAPDAIRTDDNLYVTVPRGKAYGDILEEFKSLIEQELPTKAKRRKTPPPHRFAPTEIQGIKRDSLQMMLDMQKRIFSQSELKGAALRERVLKFFSSERYKKKRNLVPMSFVVDSSNKNDDHSAEADRNIRRYRQKAKKLLLNVASGQFPGKY
jgi:hypothetical protein